MCNDLMVAIATILIQSLLLHSKNPYTMLKDKTFAVLMVSKFKRINIEIKRHIFVSLGIFQVSYVILPRCLKVPFVRSALINKFASFSI